MRLPRQPRDQDMSIAGAVKMAPHPKLGLEAEACRVRDLLVETFEIYEGLKKNYYPRILLLGKGVKQHLKVKPEMDMVEEYLRLDYKNMAAAFDITFENLVGKLNAIGSDPWEPLTIPGIPIDSELTIIEMPSQLVFSTGLNLPKQSPDVFENMRTIITSVEELLIARSLRRSRFGALLNRKLTETSNFQKSQTNKIHNDLKKFGLFLCDFEIESILSETEKGGGDSLNALLALANCYSDLKGQTHKTVKILLRSHNLKILGESFFSRHDIVLVERS